MNPYRTPRLSYLIPAAIIGLALSFDATDQTMPDTHSEATHTANRMVNLGERSESAGERSESAGERSESADPYHGMTDTERMTGVVLEPTP